MFKMGIEPEQFFYKVVYSGSHENAVIALQQGTCDAAFNWWNDEQQSNLLRMERKQMVKASDFRIIFKSEQIVNAPMAYLTDLPPDLKMKIKNAVLDIATRDPAAFEALFEGKQEPFKPIDNSAYGPIIELVKFIDNLRKKKTAS
jgi:phosphonate transport system substrate-binding protein